MLQTEDTQTLSEWLSSPISTLHLSVLGDPFGRLVSYRDDDR